MKRKIVFVFVFCCFINAYSQSDEKKIELIKESAFVHINANTFLVGEKLYYSIYIRNTQTKKESLLSKIAYVELIDEKDKRIIKHKIRLNSGRGYGSFMIPELLLSGNYKLVAYTQLMKNFRKNNFFEEDVAVINPYKTVQDDISSKNSLVVAKYNLSEEKSELINLKIEKSNYKSREKVVVNLEKINDQDNIENLSISIKKIDELDKLNKKLTSSKKYLKSLEIEKPVFVGNLEYLPELRGEIISGKLTYKNAVAPKKLVSLSIPSRNFLLKTVSTNENGEFNFNVNERYSEKNGFFQVLNDANLDYKITIKKFEPIKLSNLNFSKFLISSDYSRFILSRSIYNQINDSYKITEKENGYQKDSLQLFFGSYTSKYKLKDYVRFSSLKTTFQELISNAGILQKNGKDVFYINSLNPYLRNQTNVGVIIDGVLHQNYDPIIAYNAKNIKSISIARTETKYMLNGASYDGFIVFETLKGDFNTNQSTKSESIKKVNLFKPQDLNKYVNIEYLNISDRKRIPDYRRQLFWEPILKLDKQKNTFHFYTSDNKGTYEISVEGFSIKGKPVSIKKYFLIK